MSMAAARKGKVCAAPITISRSALESRALPHQMPGCLRGERNWPGTDGDHKDENRRIDPFVKLGFSIKVTVAKCAKGAKRRAFVAV